MKFRTICILAAAVVFSATAFAADLAAKKPRRLESVTWNSVDHKLTWVISTGEKNGDKYKPVTSQTYQIDMDAAVMSYSGENRRFSDSEATSVHKLMDLVAKYAVESTVWWDNGQGIKLDKDGKPEPVQKPQQQPHPKPKGNVTIARNARH